MLISLFQSFLFVSELACLVIKDTCNHRYNTRTLLISRQCNFILMLPSSPHVVILVVVGGDQTWDIELSVVTYTSTV